jgi:hypothetical protein
MNTTRVQLPDGRLLKIEGGDARSTAKFLLNHYLGHGLLADADDDDEPLKLPVMKFEPRTKLSSVPVTTQTPILNTEKEALSLPVMKF